MTATKNTATAVSPARKTRTRKAPARKTETGTTLALVDATKVVSDKLAEVTKVAQDAPQTQVTDKPAGEATGDALVAEAAKQVAEVTKAAKPAEKPAQALPHNGKAAAKPKLVVTDADLKRLVYVPDSQGDKAKTRHLDSCPAYFDARWDNATTFSKVDAKRQAELTPCRACARRAASERLAATK